LLIANWGRAATGRAVDVVLLVEGTDVNAVRRDVTDALPARFNMVDADRTKAALAKEGVMGSFADSLSNARVRTKSLTAVHKSLQQEGIPALIAVRTRKGRHGAREMRVVLVTGEQVEPVVEEDITVGRNDKVARKVGTLLSVPLEDVQAPSEKPVASARSAPPASAPERAAPPAERAAPAKRARPEPVESAKDEDTDEPAPAASSDDSSVRDTGVQKKRDKVDFSNGLLIVDGGLEIGSRKMAYSDPLVGPLRSYLAPGVAGYAISAQFYPGASTGQAFVKDIGIVGRYAGSLPFESKTRDGVQKATGSWTRAAVGVRGRFLAGLKTSGPFIGVEATYGMWSFVFEGDDSIVAEVPSVRYQYLRGGVDARFPFGAFALMAGAGYMQVLSAGEFTDRFPHASIAGVDGQVGAAYALLPFLEARANASYTRVFSSAKPQAGDAYIAGGALDEYFIFRGGVAAVF
jgi:hypothetical protein